MTHQKHKQSKRNAATDDTVTIGSQSFEAMWSAVVERVKTPTYENCASQGWRTAKEIEIMFKLGPSATLRRLNASVARGELDRQDCLVNGKRAFVWRPAQRKVFVPSGK